MMFLGFLFLLLWSPVMGIPDGFPTPGFIVGHTAGVATLKVLQKIESPVSCEELTFYGWLEMTKPFTRVTKVEAVNDKDYWSNGHYFVSFVTTDDAAPHGTWLVGENPGEDSGLAHIKPNIMSFVPVNLETRDVSWKLLYNGSWEDSESVRLHCTRGAVGSHFYSAQHPRSRQATVLMQTGLIDASPGAFPPQPATSPALSFSPSSISSSTYLYWHIHNKKWMSFSSDEVVAFSAGMPVRIRTVARGTLPEPALMVNDEATVEGWTLYFRLTNSGGEVERIIELGSDGVKHGAGIELLSHDELLAIEEKYNTAFTGSKRGDYLWVWLKDGDEISPYILRCEAVSSQLHGTNSSRGVAVFSYHDSHRRHIMERSILKRHTERFVATWTLRSDDSNLAVGVDGRPLSGGFRNPLYVLNGAPVSLVGLVNIGPDAISWLQDYLNSHDRVLASDIPSCFFYHGGLSMPEPLVYAAEILCVLMGAKPLSMIQYTTPSDQQWKFPLVSELIDAILTVEQLNKFSDSGETSISFDIFKYRRDETLVIYNTADRRRVDMLKPYRTAQALHIVPYPPPAAEFGIASVNAAHEEQVHNSFFNGVILGYPRRFVDAYCKDLPNKLSEGQFLRGINAAKESVASFITSGVIKADELEIRVNKTKGINPAKWNFIKHHVMLA